MSKHPWLTIGTDHPFGPHHLPYGSFAHGSGEPRLGVRIGDHVLDVEAAAAACHRDTRPYQGGNLDPLLAAGPQEWAQTREWLADLLGDEDRADVLAPHVHPVDDVVMHLPFTVADYVDFYASEHHASNVGRIFRPDSEPLTPNWKHLPIGYHGRSSTVVVSGTEITRPSGQRKAPTDETPTFGPSVKLDIEAELGFVVGGRTRLGEPVPVESARDHLFGVVLLNDWSARDLQAWEYVPLGPFLGKSFATTIAAWVTPMAALGPARVDLPTQDPQPMDYLRGEAAQGLDITYEVDWNGTVVSRPPYATMYWSPEQMIAHMTVNGATLSDGDLFGSGTVSGPEPATRGSFLELSWNGSEPVELEDGSSRTFLEDGDTVTFRATAPGEGGPLHLGECTGTICPAR
ncbi:fumarylacetoacetase [Marihabitans asiaticum]|uniref:fumarylacetoacetase n=1 Tax=Marihabitans asiaticum TaxID=415218 RepID=A0A560W831_9MICO|nr:fumarylacetoacetase [Marihabitans asiaticum]TWD13797.1 fumarylacetoacetate hydrolase [Marihabitans asiaticum]